MYTAIASIIIFGLIIFVHEFGHYIMAKLSGIRVEEFSLGMGSKVAAKKVGETLYSLRLLPLGGYCKMAGETGSEEYTPSALPDLGRFDQKPLLSRMSVIFAGPLMNFLFAIILYMLLFSAVGLPSYTTEIGRVLPDSPAEAAGLVAGDEIVEINGQPVEKWQEMTGIIYSSAEKKIDLAVKRGSATFTVAVTPILDRERNVGLIGIENAEPVIVRTGLLKGLQEGLYQTYEVTRLTIIGLVQMISGEVSTEGITGPVGILHLIGESARSGMLYLFHLTGLISINLGLLNLLPIPALDGSRLFFLLLEAFRGKPVNPQKENFVHLIGFFVLMALMVMITYRDVLRIWVNG